MTLRELAMLKFMDNITDKPDWHLKVSTGFPTYFQGLLVTPGSRSTTTKLPQSGG